MGKRFKHSHVDSFLKDGILYQYSDVMKKLRPEPLIKITFWRWLWKAVSGLWRKKGGDK